MSRLSIEKRARIAALIEQGLPLREIARREGVHHSTVMRLEKKIENGLGSMIHTDQVDHGS